MLFPLQHQALQKLFWAHLPSTSLPEIENLYIFLPPPLRPWMATHTQVLLVEIKGEGTSIVSSSSLLLLLLCTLTASPTGQEVSRLPSLLESDTWDTSQRSASHLGWRTSSCRCECLWQPPTSYPHRKLAGALPLPSYFPPPPLENSRANKKNLLCPPEPQSLWVFPRHLRDSGLWLLKHQFCSWDYGRPRGQRGAMQPPASSQLLGRWGSSGKIRLLWEDIASDKPSETQVEQISPS